MADVLAKLNLKDQVRLVVVGAPESFEHVVAALSDRQLHRSFDDLPPGDRADWVLAFGTTLAEVDAFAAGIASRTEGDTVVWFAYPKASSKRHHCEFNRDTGWASVGSVGFEPVRQVAIDEDWSALRFRRVEFIKSLTRAASGAITQEAKRRTSGQGR